MRIQEPETNTEPSHRQQANREERLCFFVSKCIHTHWYKRVGTTSYYTMGLAKVTKNCVVACPPSHENKNACHILYDEEKQWLKYYLWTCLISSVERWQAHGHQDIKCLDNHKILSSQRQNQNTSYVSEGITDKKVPEYIYSQLI